MKSHFYTLHLTEETNDSSWIIHNVSAFSDACVVLPATETKSHLKVTWKRRKDTIGVRITDLVACHMPTSQSYEQGDCPVPMWGTPARANSTLYFGHFGGLTVLVFSDHHSLPLPQALHLTRLQLGQILLLHVYPAELGAKGVVGNVLLLLGL